MKYLSIIVFIYLLAILAPAIFKVQAYPQLVNQVEGEITDSTFIEPEATVLSEIVVKPKKQKYSKKNNPAVDLMQQVRKDRKIIDPEQEDDYSYESYSKTLLGFNDFNSDLKKGNKFSKRLDFFKTFIDTATWTGKRLLSLSLKEKKSIILKGKKVSPDKEIVTGYRSVGIDQSFNQENIKAMLEDVLREINPYSNDINLLQNRFVSPLSVIGADYYKYHITDTVPVDGVDCVQIQFSPHNPESFGFNGNLFIPLKDSVKYVKRVTMRVPKAINLNYVDNLFISQNYTRDSIGKVHKTFDDISVELKIIPGTQPLYASRTSVYSNFSNSRRSDVHNYYDTLADIIEVPDYNNRNEDFWMENRMVPLSYAQNQMGSMLTQMRKVPFLYWAEKILNILVNGYISTSSNSKFDIGPVNTMIGYNTAEGLRLRFGGLTTANLSPHLFARGYVAYGFKDKKIKYSGELEYTFKPRKYHSREFPMNGIRGTYQYDKDQIGQHYLFTNADNVFLALKRMKSDLITYRRLISLEYNLELRNYLSFNIGYKNETQYATEWLPFIDGFNNNSKKYTQGYFSFTVRYAPGEKFIQGATVRQPVNMDAPIIMLTQEYGPKRLFGADFNFNKTELSLKKRFWFSAFGYANLLIKGGILWNSVPFPALLWQNANLSYTIQPESYALLNPMEFAMDKYASWDLEYFGNGILFNRIPLIKKLKLREVISYRGFVGKLSDKNNPDINPELYRFPSDAHTQPMRSTPYMELSAGIDNILTFLRVDYVWRLTYRKLPNIDRYGLRVSLHFSF